MGMTHYMELMMGSWYLLVLFMALPMFLAECYVVSERDCHEFCVHGIIGARYTGTPHEHDYQETNLS